MQLRIFFFVLLSIRKFHFLLFLTLPSHSPGAKFRTTATGKLYFFKVKILVAK